MKLGRLVAAIVLGLGCYGVPVMAQQPTEPVPDFESSEVRKETFIAEAEKVVRSIGADNLRVLAIADLAGLYTMLGETEAAGAQSH